MITVTSGSLQKPFTNTWKRNFPYEELTVANQYAVDGLGGGNWKIAVQDNKGCMEYGSLSIVGNEERSVSYTAILLYRWLGVYTSRQLCPNPIVLDAGGNLEIDLGDNIVLHLSTNLANPVVSWQPPGSRGCTGDQK